MKQINMVRRILTGHKRKLLFSFAMFLCCITVIGGVHASFHSGSSSYQNVTIAAYAVSAGTSHDGVLHIDCNTTVSDTTFEFWVGNSENNVVAEVDVNYTIFVTIPSELPQGITLDIDGIEPEISAGRTRFTFHSTDFYLENGTTDVNTHVLRFTANQDQLLTNVEIANIIVSIYAQQVD